MSDCQACTAAATTPHWATFNMGCLGCKARAVSRGKNFRESKAAGKQTPLYRMELSEFEVTHAQVIGAWQADASNRAKETTT
jgi:hypothetical protein